MQHLFSSMVLCKREESREFRFVCKARGKESEFDLAGKFQCEDISINNKINLAKKLTKHFFFLMRGRDAPLVSKWL